MCRCLGLSRNSVFSPLAPTLGGKLKNWGTPLILRRVYDQTLGKGALPLCTHSTGDVGKAKLARDAQTPSAVGRVERSETRRHRLHVHSQPPWPPILGERKKWNRGTPSNSRQRDAAPSRRVSVGAHCMRPGHPKTPGREESCALFGQAQRQPQVRGFWWWLIAMGFVVRILRVGETLAVR